MSENIAIMTEHVKNLKLKNYKLQMSNNEELLELFQY